MEYSVHPIFDQTLERALELAMRIGKFELEKVQISLCFIEVKRVKAVIISRKGDLVGGYFSWKLVLAFKVQQAKVVFRDTSKNEMMVGVHLVDHMTRDIHPLFLNSGPTQQCRFA
jgi:hypothetical protein